MTYTAKSAAEELRKYNEWRRGNDSYDDETGPDPVELGRLIEFSIDVLENVGASIERQHAAAEQLAGRVMQVEQQRDDLLAALENALSRQSYKPGHGPEWYEKGHSVVASVKGGAA